MIGLLPFLLASIPLLQAAPSEGYAVHAKAGRTRVNFSYNGFGFLFDGNFRSSGRTLKVADLRRDDEVWTLRLKAKSGDDPIVQIRGMQDGRFHLQPGNPEGNNLVLQAKIMLPGKVRPVALYDPHDGILQLRIGKVSSARCDALLDAQGNRSFTSSGRLDLSPWESGVQARVKIPIGTDAWVEYREDALNYLRGLKNFQPMDRSRQTFAPVGWTSEVHFWDATGPEVIQRNARWVAGHLIPFGARYIQVGSPGLKDQTDSLAQAIRNVGLLPGTEPTSSDRWKPNLFAGLPEWEASEAASRVRLFSPEDRPDLDKPRIRKGPADWSTVRASLEATKQGLWLNNLGWWNDPGPLEVGGNLTLDEARTWATLVGLTGQAVIACEDMASLPPERVKILTSIIPTQNIIPYDLHAFEEDPEILDLRVARDDGGPAYDMVALFNWTPWERMVKVDFAQLGWEDPGDDYLIFDFWNGTAIGYHKNGFRLSVPPHGVRLVQAELLSRGTPRFLCNSRHLAGPHAAGWQLSLAGGPRPGKPWKRTWKFDAVTDIPGQEGWSIFYLRQAGGSALNIVAALDQDKKPLFFNQQGSYLWVKLKPTDGQERRVYLTAEGVVFPKEPLEPLPVEMEGGVPHLQWKLNSVTSAVRIERDGFPLAVVSAPEWRDFQAPPGTELTYSLFPEGMAKSKPTLITVRTPASVRRPLQVVPPARQRPAAGIAQAGFSVHEKPLRVGGETFSNGIGVQAASRLEYRIGDTWTRFEAKAGVDEEAGKGRGAVIFRVYVDGTKVAESPVLKAGDPPHLFQVPLKGHRNLALETVTNEVTGKELPADWCDAYLVGE